MTKALISNWKNIRTAETNIPNIRATMELLVIFPLNKISSNRVSAFCHVPLQVIMNRGPATNCTKMKS